MYYWDEWIESEMNEASRNDITVMPRDAWACYG